MFLSVKLTDEDEAPVMFKTAEQLELYIKKGCSGFKDWDQREKLWGKKFLMSAWKKSFTYGLLECDFGTAFHHFLSIAKTGAKDK